MIPSDILHNSGSLKITACWKVKIFVDEKSCLWQHEQCTCAGFFVSVFAKRQQSPVVTGHTSMFTPHHAAVSVYFYVHQLTSTQTDDRGTDSLLTILLQCVGWHSHKLVSWLGYHWVQQHNVHCRVRVTRADHKLSTSVYQLVIYPFHSTVPGVYSSILIKPDTPICR